MKYLKWASAILSLLVALGGGVSIFRHGADSVSPVGGVRNRYEAAQHQTVLIVAPTGQGTGIPVLRGTRVFVWTAAHVVEGHATVKVQSIIRHNYHRVGTTEFVGRVVSINKALDVALLYVDAPSRYFLAAEFDSLIPPPVGSAVYHVGNFLGADFDNSVSTGVISQHGAKPVNEDGWPWQITDQTTATVVPGSSGGPIFNAANGKVIGILVGTIPGRGINFYVPIRALEVWADSAGLSWAVRGNFSPAVLPTVAVPIPLSFIRIFNLNP